MKKRFQIFSLSLFLITQLLGFQETAKAVTAYPHPIVFTQPDGSKINIQLKGDEKVHWAVSSDGYALLFNAGGTYEYAMKNNNGDMVPSGIQAHNPDYRSTDEVIFLENIPKYLAYSKTQINALKQIWNITNNSAKTGGFPTTGTRKFLLILANYNNTSTTYTQAMFYNYMNQVNYNSTGSFRDYFLETSYGQLTINTTVTVWVTLPNTHDYYGPKANWDNMVYDAIVAANPLVDYSQYDNNGDGVVDGVAVIHQGYGQEESANTNDVWSHNWDLTSAGYTPAQRTFDGVQVNAYTTQPERSSTGMGTIGVMCHEFGHNLGAPDFYDTDYTTNGQYDGTGSWDLQADGSWNGSPAGSTPAPPNAFTKTAIYGWATAQVISSGANYTLYNSDQNSNSFYRINTTTSNEYFLCENKQQIGFDSYDPGHGMIIYHVDGTYITNHSSANDINVGSHQGLYVVCSNASGDPPTVYGTINGAACPYPGSSAKTSFTDATVPSSKSWAVAATSKPITNITENSTAKTISFTFMGGPGCSLPATQASVFTSCAITTNSMTVGWTRGSGNGVLVVARAGNPVNADPVLGTTYTANAAFGSGNQVGTGNYVVYKGTGTSVDISALSTNITYYYSVYEYTSASSCYLTPALTGNAETVTSPTPPVADFISDKTTINPGESVAFFETVSNNPTSWSWTFEGGNPPTSTDRTPVVTWVSAGTYDVSLTATNADGSNTKTKLNYVTVNSLPGLPSPDPKTIGAGTSNGTYWPLGISTQGGATYRYVADASIYTSSEIGGAGKLTKIEWYPNAAQADSRNIQIYVKHTSDAIFYSNPTSFYTTGATLVYSGTFTPTPIGWVSFNLTNTFNYNGTSNLMVIVLVNSSGSPGNKASNCYYTATSSNLHQQWNGSTAPAGSGTVNTSRPNIRMTFASISAPTANFAGIDAPFFTETFEGSFPPAGWTINNADGAGQTWGQSSSQNHTSGGSKSAEHPDGASGYAENGYLISPQINIPSGGAVLSFWSYNNYPTYYGTNSVLLSTTTNAVSSFTVNLWQPSGVTAGWVNTQIDLSAVTGNIYLAFRYQGTYAHQWYVDDVTLSGYNSTQITAYEGDPVSIFDKSTGNPLIWEWTTTGAEASVYNSQNISTSYNTAGLYPLSLKASNLAGGNTKTVSTFVNVVGRVPVASFIGKGNLTTSAFKPFIPTGGSVTFSDLSTHNPTSWTWTFSNGNPASSNVKSPPEVTYNNTGNYDVSLTAANTDGNNTKTSVGYVNVMGTNNVTNLLSDDVKTYYSPTAGKIPGHGYYTSSSTNYYFYQWAEFFKNSYAGQLTKLNIYVALAAGTGKYVTFYVWDGATGEPGTILASKTLLITSFTAGALNTVTFDSPVDVTGNFFVGYLLNYDASHDYATHQFCAYTAKSRSGSENSTAWVKSGTTAASALWHPLDDIFSIETSIALEPEFTYKSCPKVYNLTGGGSYCSGETGVAIGLDGSETSVNYQLKKEGLNDGSPIPGTGSAISFGNKTAGGTYTAVATFPSTACSNDMNGSAVVTPNACFTWTGAVSSDWSILSNWSSGKVPVASDVVVIPSAPLLQPHVTALPASPAICKDLLVYPGATLTIDPGKALTTYGPTNILGNFIIESDPSGTGSFIDNGTISGNATVKKYLTNGRYWYIGSPLSNAKASAFGTLSSTQYVGNRLFYWNETTHAYENVTDINEDMPVLRGYSFRSFTDPSLTVIFTGSLNTGNIGSPGNLTYTSGTSQGFNLVSNPYPSAIDIELLGPNTTNLLNVVWFKSGSVYPSYNWVSHLGTLSGQQYIPAMQAFWVHTNGSAGGIMFNNAIRHHYNGSPFYKKTAENNVFRIEVSRDSLVDEAVVAFFNNADLGFDPFDSEKMFSSDDNYPQIYTPTLDNVLTVVNGQPDLNDGTERIVPLGFITHVAGNFSFKATNMADFDPNTSVYLEDSLAGYIQDMGNDDSYHFSSGIVNDQSRFKLHFGGTFTGMTASTENSASLYSIGHTIYVSTLDHSLIEIYNMLGEKIYQMQLGKGLNKIQLNNCKGIYIAKVLSGSEIFTKKIYIGD